MDETTFMSIKQPLIFTFTWYVVVHQPKPTQAHQASHLWVDGRLPQPRLIVAEHSGHHLQLLLGQVWRG